MCINRDKPDLWKTDIQASVDDDLNLTDAQRQNIEFAERIRAMGIEESDLEELQKIKRQKNRLQKNKQRKSLLQKQR